MYVEVGRLNLMTHLKYDRVIIMVSIDGTNARQNIHLVNCSNLSPTTFEISINRTQSRLKLNS